MIKKVLFCIGSRANYSSIKSVILEFSQDKNIEVQIILFSSSVLQRYGSLIDYVKKDGLKVNYVIYNQIEGENPLTMAKSTGLALIEMTSAFNQLNPDIVFTVGDRYETMATVLAASYMNIPLAHTMGGEVSGTIDESIRHAITKFSHIHFPASRDAYQRIIKLGEEKNNVHLVGCPRIDLVKNYLLTKNVLSFEKLNQVIFKNGVGKSFDLKKGFVLVSQHPVTTEYKKNKENILVTLNSIKKLNLNALVLWPNSDAGSDLVSQGIRIFREKNPNLNFFYIKNLEIIHYVNLMHKTKCLIGNSSSGIREGAYIGTPVVNLGTRQNHRERGKNVLDCNFNMNEVTKAIKKQISINKSFLKNDVYGNGNASKKIIKIIKSLKNIKIQKTITY